MNKKVIITIITVVVALITGIAMFLFVRSGFKDFNNNSIKKENESNVMNNVSNQEENSSYKNEKQKELTTPEKEVNSVNVEGLGNKYVDYDNRSFAINGKVYTLGKTTLQEMIDDGVPFTENSLKNVSNNVNKNHESESFSINLDTDTHITAQIKVLNNTDQSAPASNLKLSYIYLPISRDEQIEKASKKIQFAFPLTVTYDEFISNAGEPTNKNNNETSDKYKSQRIEYKIKSEQYMGSSGYSIEFLNGSLRYVTISYMP